MVRLVLQRPEGTDIAFVEASNAKADSVITNFLKWLYQSDASVDVDAMTEVQKADALLAFYRSYTVKKAKQFAADGIRESKGAEVSSELAALTIEWEA